MMRPGDILLKSRQVEHEDLFGQAGAVIASIEFIEDDPFRGPPDGRSWHRTASAPALRHFTALLEAASAQDVTAARCAGLDLLADDARAETRESNAADWVSDLRQELEERGLPMSMCRFERAKLAFTRRRRPVYSVVDTEHRSPSMRAPMRCAGQ
jgi:hypothetical protein